MLVNVYDYSVTYRGRRMEESSEPPESFIQHLCQQLIQAAIMRRDYESHVCNSECAISSYVIMGHPYAENLFHAVPR